MKIGYFAPSYKRPQKSTTQILYPFVKLVVKEDEAEKYKANRNDIIVAPNDKQGNLCRIRNWILDTYLDQYDAIVLLDDDNNGIGRFENQKWNEFNENELEEFCEEMTILCKDYNFYFWGINCIPDKGAYREHTPFATNAYIGGPFQVWLKGNDLRYDENLPLKEDYDITLQNHLKYKGALRVNFASYKNKQSEQVGGCASYRNLEREKEQFYRLQRKWGSNIIKQDNSSRRSFDYNPIMKTFLK